jgi:lysophospholipase L1-like esterase
MKVKKVLIITSSIILTLVLLEAGLRVLTAFLIYSPKNNLVYDDRLGRKFVPSVLDIDENGFRNPGVPGEVDIVAMGDSHTYGVNVKSENSWPAQLARMSGLSIYNSGVGGYGTLQYYYLFDSAVKLKPERIILALYPANDLNDVCKIIEKLDYWREWARARGYDTGVCTGSSGRLSRINMVLSASHLYWTAARAIKRVNEGTDFGDSVRVSDGKNPTLIKYGTIGSHRKYMDLERERISLGLAVTEDMLREMSEKARSMGIEFSVVLIPSKEVVFFDYLKEKGYELPADYTGLVENENKLVAGLSRFFKSEGIRFADARPYIEKELYTSRDVYSTTDDGHPLEAGYNAYARAVYESILSAGVSGNGRGEPGN